MADVVENPDIEPVALADALTERYLAYAMSTITSRSLPDVRDGLKPVHRRLLYAMRQLRLDPREGFKKSARVVGDVIGKYHPHGDQSIYDALVRLAQEFAARYPLVDGQGNFGNIDGDNAAAMRYTEARMTEVAIALLEGLDDDAVDFRDTYDGSEEEPVVLPARFPNLLANGATGIAVGMATSIPPHNVDELCQALVHLVDKPRATFETLTSMVQGPDFPTGGELVESREAIMEAYATGRGSFRLRARWTQEDLGRGTYQIVVTEVPYQVQKSKLVERIAELVEARKLPLLEAVIDESAKDIRLVLTPKSRTVDAAVLMESLFRATDLETRFSLNMNLLDSSGMPRVMNLRETLQEFIDHRRVVLLRCSRHRLDKIARRLDILEGYLIVYLNLDEVIAIIRGEDEAKPALIKRFKLNDTQAEAILNMRLRSLRKLEEMEIANEKTTLTAESGELDALVKSESKQKSFLKAEFKDIRAKFGEKTELGRRRTKVGDTPPMIEVPIDATIEREAVTVVLSVKGWIRAAKGHGDQVATLRYKEGDRERFRAEAWTTDRLLLFATNGRFYTIGCDKLPGGRGYGDPVRLMLDLGNDVEIVAMSVFQGGRWLLVASSEGRGFVVPEDAVAAQTRAGKQVLNVSPGSEAVVARIVEGDHVAVVGENRKVIIFPLDELPEMTRGRGVILQRYKSGGMSDAKTFTLAEGLTWQAGSRTRTETKLTDWVGKRSQAGRVAPAGFASNNRFD
ncbi:MAG: DNA topoisomerase IV subunit A [Alphaproteobacteria bacterium]|jgi:topoisomerase IV subunit A|nr:DNA topoisomerase IV subunit A [Alphaproteobacteria bacterium]